MNIITTGRAARNSTDLVKSNSLVDLCDRLKAEHIAAAGALKCSLGHAMAAGDILIEAKEQLKHGHWLPWLQSCGISERAAQRYIRLARNRRTIEAKSDNVSDLSVSGALAMLAVPRDDPSGSLTQGAADSALAQFELEVILARLDSFPKRRALFDEASAAMDKIRDLYLGQPIEQQSTFAKLIESGTESEELIATSQSYVAIAADPNAAIKAATSIRDIATRWASRVESAVPDQGCA